MRYLLCMPVPRLLRVGYSHFLNEGQEVTHIFALGYSHINLHRLSLCIAFLSFHLQGTLNKLLIFVTRHFKKSLFSCKTSRIIIKSYSPSEKKTSYVIKAAN